MKMMRLRDKILLGAVAISIVVALASMLAVSWVISQQYQDQSHALLSKSSVVINDSLDDRKTNVLTASRQLAMQKNLGSTIWYLTQYSRLEFDHETMFNSYQQLVNDTYKIARVAMLSRITIYDSAGRLVSFAQLGGGSGRVGFVENGSVPSFWVALLKENEELSRPKLHTTNAITGVDLTFGQSLPRQGGVHYAVVDGLLAIESYVPIIGNAFDPLTGKQVARQLGLVVGVQLLDQTFVDYLSKLTDIKINVFTRQGLSSGDVAAYQKPDWSGVQQVVTDTPVGRMGLNEIKIEGQYYYQGLIPLYNGKRLVGTIAELYSKEIVQKNTWEMVRILGLIAVASLLFIFPFAWYFAKSISYPLTALSRVFLGIASGKQADTLHELLGRLEKNKNRHDELGDLTQSFIAMDDAVNQKIQQINEINATLEHKIEQRTQELRFANEALTKLATHDTLTELPNRNLLRDRLQRSLAAARRENVRMALIFIDLDEFKSINDTRGHAVGDLLLMEAAKRMQDCIRESDTVSRIGGDEFIVLLPNIEAEQDVMRVAEKIRSVLNQPFELMGGSLHISSSIGIAICPEHGGDESTLLKNADTAMYYAKKSGGNTVTLFSTVLSKTAVEINS